MLLADGHTTRVTMGSVLSMIKHSMQLFLSPPTATELYQALDQTFQCYHDVYVTEKEALVAKLRESHKSTVVTRELAVQLIARVIRRGWASKTRMVKAFGQVGITADGIDKYRVRDLDLLPEVPPSTPTQMHHNPSLSDEDMRLEQEKDKFIVGPAKVESPKRLPSEPELEYLRRRGDVFKATAVRSLSTPSSARDSGLLPHRHERLVAGEEFMMMPHSEKRRIIKRPASGPIDLQAMRETLQKAKIDEQRVADRAAERAAADLKAFVPLVAAGLLARGDKVTNKVMKLYCKQHGIRGVASMNRDDLIECVAGIGKA